MKVQETAFKVINWSVDNTLHQQLKDPTQDKPVLKMACQPYLNFDKHREEKKALVTMEWTCGLDNMIEYVSETRFHVDYNNYDNEVYVVHEIIATSISRAATEFDERITGITAQQFIPEFFTDQQSESYKQLHKKIFRRLRVKK